MRILLRKLKDVLISVVPVVAFVLIVQLILHLSKSGQPVQADDIWRFLIASVVLIIGLTVLLIGIELSVNKVGSDSSNVLLKSRKLWLILPITFLLGFIIAIAEPDLLILSKQVSELTNGIVNMYALIISIAVGVGVAMLVAVIRVLFKVPVRAILVTFYGLIIILSIVLLKIEPDLFPIAFDSSASVTGAVAVPFILAFGIGLSRSNKSATEDESFGMVGITSAGTILAATIYLLIKSKQNFLDVSPSSQVFDGVFMPFVRAVPGHMLEAFIALAPFLVIFLILQFTMIKEPLKQALSKLSGFIYIFFGLTLFLVSANVGYIGIGRSLGNNLSALGVAPTVIIAFILGALIILSESSVHVLTEQIYDVTSGSLKKIPVLASLSSGVGIALILLSLRGFYPQIRLEYLILPLYVIALVLSFFAPKLFVGLAFDSGAVASGPLAATFILAFVQGIALHGSTDKVPIGNLFGTLAIVTVVPIIALLILGLIWQSLLKKEAKLNEAKTEEQK